MITASNITDDQIRELRASTKDARVASDCDEALWDEHISSKEITAARARCAELLNRRGCAHDLVEVLSVNGRNLDGAQRVCARCGFPMGAA